MRVRSVLVCAVLLAGAAACGPGSPDQGPETTTAAVPPVAAPAPAPPPTLDLRLKVKPQTDKLFSVTLPRQKPGGTMISWSAYLSGVGSAASTTRPLKAECYVVQATGKKFGDRVFYFADDSSVSTGDDVSLSGSGVVDTRDGKVLIFECELDENRPEPIPGLTWRTLPEQPIQVAITPLPAYRQKTKTAK